METNLLTAEEKRDRNISLMEDLVEYLCRNGIFYDVNIYVNGRVFSSNPCKGSAARSVNGYICYDCGECNVAECVEYSNPETVTMTFEGPLYHAYNGYDPYTHAEKDIWEIAEKYGLYPEQGYAWSLAFYE